MDFENFFYVILAVIYFLSRVMRGNKKKAPQAPTAEEDSSRPAKKPVSFEDLLKEFGVEQEEEERAPVEEVYEEEEFEEPEPKRPAYSDEESKSIFEQSIREAEMAASSGTADEQSKMAFKEFKPYQEQEEENTLGSELAETLRSADGAKRAVILSEILKRKY